MICPLFFNCREGTKQKRRCKSSSASIRSGAYSLRAGISVIRHKIFYKLIYKFTYKFIYEIVGGDRAATRLSHFSILVWGDMILLFKHILKIRLTGKTEIIADFSQT